MQRTMPGARRRGRPHTAWMDNIETWKRLPVKESIRITHRDQWRKCVHGVVMPSDGGRLKNRTEYCNETKERVGREVVVSV